MGAERPHVFNRHRPVTPSRPGEGQRSRPGPGPARPRSPPALRLPTAAARPCQGRARPAARARTGRGRRGWARSPSGGAARGRRWQASRSSSRLAGGTARSQHGGTGASAPRGGRAPLMSARGRGAAADSHTPAGRAGTVPAAASSSRSPFHAPFSPRARRPQATRPEARSRPAGAPEEPGVARRQPVSSGLPLTKMATHFLPLKP